MKIPRISLSIFHRRSKQTSHPLRDWFGLLLLGCVLVILLAVVGYNMSKPLALDAAATEAPRVRTVNREKLAETVKAFTDKEKVFDTLWLKRPSYISPQ